MDPPGDTGSEVTDASARRRAPAVRDAAASSAEAVAGILDPPGDTGSEVVEDSATRRAPAVGEASSAEEDAGNMERPVVDLRKQPDGGDDDGWRR